MSLQDPYSFDNFSDVDSEKQEVDAEIEQTIRRIEQASPMDVDIPASSQTNAGTIKDKLQRRRPNKKQWILQTLPLEPVKKKANPNQVLSGHKTIHKLGLTLQGV